MIEIVKGDITDLEVEKKTMKVTFIIGNGFNHLIKSIVNNTNHHDKHETVQKIGAITSLWGKFNDIFDKLKNEIHDKTEEELISMVYAVLDFFPKIEGFKNVLSDEDMKCVGKLKTSFHGLIIKKIRDIVEEFRQHEGEGGYGKIKKIFPSFGEDFKKIFDDNNVVNCDFFTTNYDGILDTLLTEPVKWGNHISVDGFGETGNNNDYLILRENNLSAAKHKMRVFHIHGSYKFGKTYNETYKLKKGKKNINPVIVFDSPNQKENIIYRDSVLSKYYSILEESLKNSDKLIILGNSMINEPHLKKKIKEHFNKETQCIYTCSIDPASIADQLKDFHYNTIFQKNTSGISSIDDLLNFLNEIIKDEEKNPC